MYCKKCYTNLTHAADAVRCPKCGRTFAASDPKTYLPRPFPSGPKILGHIIVTTLVGILAAFIVATFQAAGASGH